jgi:hypothetical protein
MRVVGETRVRRVLDGFFFGFIPMLPFIPVFIQLAVRRRYLGDGWFFDGHWLWRGWQHVVHGQNPYVDFLYPAPAAVLPAPIGWLGYRPAMIVWTILLFAAIVVSLRLLGVLDWRCYGIALLSMPALSSIHLGTPTPVLMLSAALAWRYRNRPWLVSAGLALGIGFKIMLWPLLVWLAVTRFWTSVRAGLTTVALVAGCWAVIGFAGMSSYGGNLRGTEEIDQYKGYSIVALAHRAGLGLRSAHIVLALVALALVALIVVAGRRKVATADRDAFIVAIGTTLLAAPVIWGHYFLLVFVAFALTNRSFGIEWLLPLAFWVVPQEENFGSAVPIVLGLGLFIALLVWSARRDQLMDWERRRRRPVGLTRAPVQP